jgi:hypothetical protein
VAEQRAETRFLCSDLVSLRWCDPSGRERRETVVLENISASGACVQAEVSVSESTRVSLDCGKAAFHGYVRSCYWRDDGYFVGIAFDADSKWSAAKFKPEHLLDPRKVKPRKTGTKPLMMFAGSRVLRFYLLQPTASRASFATLAVLLWMVTVSCKLIA